MRLESNAFHGNGTRSSPPVRPSVAWLANGVSAHYVGHAEDEVVAFLAGDSVLVTVRPKNERPAMPEIALPTGEGDLRIRGRRWQ